MARIPYEVRHGIYNILLRDGEIKIDEMYRKASFI